MGSGRKERGPVAKCQWEECQQLQQDIAGIITGTVIGTKTLFN